MPDFPKNQGPVIVHHLKNRRGVGSGGGRKEGERSHEGMEGYQLSPKELKGGNVTAENSPATD